jgi:hypothetical protein
VARNGWSEAARASANFSDFDLWAITRTKSILLMGCCFEGQGFDKRRQRRLGAASAWLEAAATAAAEAEEEADAWLLLGSLHEVREGGTCENTS